MTTPSIASQGARLAACAASLAIAATLAYAQQSTEVVLTATSANVAEPGNPAKIQILGWSTEKQRAQLVAALNPPPAPPTPPPAAADDAARGRAAGAAGRGGRGGRGRGRGGEPAAPPTPIEALTAAIAGAPTIGYIWTNDVTGYAIKYAVRLDLPGGGERMILATDRRLGTHTAAWQPDVDVPLTDYEFTLIEIRRGADGAGVAKTSLTNKVVVDAQAGTVALENFASAPAILEKVVVAGQGG